MVEIHPCPEKAISDGAQSLNIPQFEAMMKQLKPYIALWNEARAAEMSAVAS